MKTRAQTAIEYTMIIGGAIMFVVLVVLILRSGVIGRGQQDIINKTNDYEDRYLKNYLFVDEFESVDGTNSKWTVPAGTWSVANGVYHQENNAVTARALTKAVFSNFTAVVKLRPTGTASILLRSNNLVSQYYELRLSGTTAQIFENAANVNTTNGAFADVTNRYVLVKIVADGASLSVYADNSPAPVISYVDASPILAGRLGLQTINSRADFEYARVYSNT